MTVMPLEWVLWRDIASIALRLVVKISQYVDDISCREKFPTIGDKSPISPDISLGQRWSNTLQRLKNLLLLRGFEKVWGSIHLSSGQTHP